MRPLLVALLAFVPARGPLATAPPRARLPPPTYELNPPDYYDNLDGTPAASTPRMSSPDGRSLRQCDYRPCAEQQPSCAQLQASSGCLCPGLTLHSQPPLPPRLEAVSWDGSEVVARWCAPLSYVTAYQVTVGGRLRRRFPEGARSGAVGVISRSAEVCVAAVNDAGVGEASCVPFDPRDDSLALKAGLVGGALGLLLLFTLLVLLCRRRRNRKAARRRASGGVAQR